MRPRRPFSASIRTSGSPCGGVNERVNRTILAVTDQDHWGVVDRWDYPDDGLGDCEDIQLLKRKLLIEAGLPRRAMRMTVVIDEQARPCGADGPDDRGDFILDNKRDAVLAMARDRLPLREAGGRRRQRMGLAWEPDHLTVTATKRDGVL